MKRTKELDDHWYGYWWCETCQHYTGQTEHHQGHKLEWLDTCPSCGSDGLE